MMKPIHSLFLAALAFATGTALAQQRTSYVVFDGQKYQSDQLEWAASNPVQFKAPYVNDSGWYTVARAADGHFYLPSSLNGFPVIFMVDTGASTSSIGPSIARNAGIRAGVSGKARTANGVSVVAKSEGNTLVTGPFAFRDVSVAVSTNPATGDMALLGMDLLKRLQMYQGSDYVMFKRHGN